MSKFTLITLMLAISVVTVTANLVVRDSWSRSGTTSVIPLKEGEEISPVLEQKGEEQQTAGSFPKSVPQEPIREFPAAPLGNSVSSPVFVSRITQNLLAQSDFKAILLEKQFSGKVFQLLDITKIPIDAVNFYEISDGRTSVVSITEIALQDEIRALQLYVLLQNKTKTYIDVSLNETNAYGDRSFYINHAKKPEEAFLTVKMGRTIYSFAYVKFYHPQIKKMIQLLYG